MLSPKDTAGQIISTVADSSRSKKAVRTFPCTDAGNAELFAVQFGDRVRYDHRQGRWLSWDPNVCRWAADTGAKILLLAIETARMRLGSAQYVRSRQRRESQAKWALQSEDRHRLYAALDIAKSLPPIFDDGQGWDADPMLLGVANGIVDLKTGGVQQERPEDLVTKHSPVRFDPDAKCPRFERFVQEIFPDDESLVEYIQRSIGYCMTGSVQEQVVFCWWGSGANGKSTLGNLLRHILGDYAANLPFSALEMKNRNSNDLVVLAGCRFATAAETNEGVRLNEARIKVLTGGDPITARKLYHESFTFDPTHKLILAFNHKPIIADDSIGMWRRVHLIPFTRQFQPAEQDKDLPDKLKEEAEGILAWAIKGCIAWQKEGLPVPPSVAAATTAYRKESDHLGQFIEDCCIVESSATVPSGSFWQRYQMWTKHNEEIPLARNVFCERLERRGFHRRRSGHEGTRTWVGIGLQERKNKKLSLETPFPDADTLPSADAASEHSPIQGDI